MAASALRAHVNFALIAHKTAMPPLAQIAARGVIFVMIAQHHTMESAPNEGGNGMCRTVGQASINLFFVTLINHACGDIGTKFLLCGLQERRRFKRQMGVAKVHIIATHQRIKGLMGHRIGGSKLQRGRIERMNRKSCKPQWLCITHTNTHRHCMFCCF